MARKVDLTGRLGLGERPRIIVADGVELEVDDSARTVMLVLDAVQGEMTPDKAMDACTLLFGEQGRAVLNGLGLSFSGFLAVLEAAVGLVMGGGDADPKGETPATTS